MNGFYIAFALTACLAATGCSSKIPETAAAPITTPAGAAVPPDYTQSTTEKVQPNENNTSPVSAREKSSKRTKRLARQTGSHQKSVIAPKANRDEDAEDLKVSGIAKVVSDEDACLSTKHGHAAFLRSDLAYSITGIDCQVDLPKQISIQ